MQHHSYGEKNDDCEEDLPIGNETAWVTIIEVDARPYVPEYAYPESESDISEQSYREDKDLSVLEILQRCIDLGRQYPGRATLVFLTILGVVLLALCYTLASPMCSTVLGPEFDGSLYHSTSLSTPANKTYNIVLFGDSLVDNVLKDYRLSAKVSRFLPTWNFNFENYGISGARARDLRQRVDTMLQNTK